MQMTRGLEFPSVDSSIDLIDDIVKRRLKTLGYDEEAQYRTSIAVREAAANAHKHGNKKDPTKTIGICLEYDDSSFTIYVSDSGTEEVNASDHFELKGDLLLTHGRGIYFMHAFLDERPVIEYIMSDGSIEPNYPKNGNAVVGKRIRLVKYRPSLLPNERQLGQQRA